MLVGFVGLASASAIASALLPSVAPRDVSASSAVTGPGDVAGAVPAADPRVVHVTRIVQLLPGETPPPQATVIVAPTPTPRVKVVTTRQSGKP